MSRKFDTKSTTTITRAELNDRYAKYDLEEWMFSQLHLSSDMNVLDIGCGGGKQLCCLAEKLTAKSKILGIDISKDVVDSAREKAKGFANVEVRQMNFEDSLSLLSGERFDLIISTYAIYYAADVEALLVGLRGLLNEGGCVFVVGPGAGTNSEIIDLANLYADKESDVLSYIEDFVYPETVDAIARSYSKVRVARLNNHINFPDAASVMLWWRSHNSFRPLLDTVVESDVEEVVFQQGDFRLSKPVLGVLFDA
jgi:ubiquinone/menaquinone biosynthesis C-methylase UbiE